jgi:hypothetical protein
VDDFEDLYASVGDDLARIPWPAFAPILSCFPGSSRNKPSVTDFIERVLWDRLVPGDAAGYLHADSPLPWEGLSEPEAAAAKDARSLRRTRAARSASE